SADDHGGDLELVPGGGQVGGVLGLVPEVHGRVVADDLVAFDDDRRHVELGRAGVLGAPLVGGERELLRIGARRGEDEPVVTALAVGLHGGRPLGPAVDHSGADLAAAGGGGVRGEAYRGTSLRGDDVDLAVRAVVHLPIVQLRRSREGDPAIVRGVVRVVLLHALAGGSVEGTRLAPRAVVEGHEVDVVLGDAVEDVRVPRGARVAVRGVAAGGVGDRGAVVAPGGVHGAAPIAVARQEAEGDALEGGDVHVQLLSRVRECPAVGQIEPHEAILPRLVLVGAGPADVRRIAEGLHHVAAPRGPVALRERGRAEPGLLDDPRARLGDPAGPGAAVLLADRGDHGVPGPAVREGHRVPIGRGGVAADAAHLAGAAPELLTLQLAVGLEHGELGDLLDAQSVQGALLADTEAVELALAAHRDGAGRAPID